MKLTVLFDKEKKDKAFKSGWGISYLVNNDILFDTGESFDFIKNNAALLGGDLSQIRHVVISHEHWDHTEGLWELLKTSSHITVYGCMHFSRNFQDKVVAYNATYKPLHAIQAIAADIYTSGEFRADYKGTVLYEQALIVQQEKGLAVICGCAHPGIVQMLANLQNQFKKKVNFLIGGLHLMDKEKRLNAYIVSELKKIGITEVFPGHCTGFEAIHLMRTQFPTGCTLLRTGDVISL